MRVNNKSFTLIEVIIAAVLLTIGVAGGIAGYKIADRQIERANIKNMLISENQTVAEKIVSWDMDDHESDLVGGKTYDVTDEVSNTKLAKFSPKVTYTVTDRTTPAPYKEIVVNAEVTYGGKTIKVQTGTIKVNVEEPILLFCGDGVVNQPSEECEPPNTATCNANCKIISPPSDDDDDDDDDDVIDDDDDDDDDDDVIDDDDDDDDDDDVIDDDDDDDDDDVVDDDDIGGCFTADTEIMTKDGLKQIKELTVQDKVLSYNKKTKQTEYKPVEFTWKFKNKEILEIVIQNGISIKVTSTHPFWGVHGKIKAGELMIGDRLLTNTNDYVKITNIKQYNYTEPITTYNLTIKDNHSFFVGETGVLVGNINVIKNAEGAVDPTLKGY